MNDYYDCDTYSHGDTEARKLKTISFMIVALLVGVPCLAQNSGQPTKQEIVALAHKADESVTLFEQANKAADPFIPDSAVKKGADAASTAHQLVDAITKNGLSAYALVSLVIALNDVTFNAAVDAQTISRKAMTAATAGQTVNLNALAAADSLSVVQSSCKGISEQIGHAALRLIKEENGPMHNAAR
ncbi:MAG: hypothetical protein WB723_14110 [Candidatus Acidiferrales bacterium]